MILEKIINLGSLPEQMNGTKAQVESNIVVGFVIIMIGVLAVTFVGFGFIFTNPTLVWVGTVVLGIISVITAILEKVMLR